MKRALTILLVLALVAAGPVAALLLRQQPVSSGDPLLDAYATLPRSEMRKPGGTFKAMLKLKDKFASDPRYWQLLTYLQEPNYQGSAGQMYSYEHLLEGIRRGAANPASYGMVSLFAVAEEDPELARELADKAIASDPENALFYYRKGELLVTLGEYEPALAAFRKGNNTPLNELPLPFPLEAFLDERYVPELFPYSRASLGYWLDMNPKIEVKNVHKDVIARAKVGDLDLASVNVFYTAAVRQSMTNNTMVIDALVSQVIIGLYLDSQTVKQISTEPKVHALATNRASQMRSIHNKLSARINAPPPNPSLVFQLRQRLNPDAMDWKVQWNDLRGERPFVQSLSTDFAKLLPSPYAVHTN